VIEALVESAIARAGVEPRDDEQSRLLGLSDFLVRMAQRDAAEFQSWLDERPYVRELEVADVQATAQRLALDFPVRDASREKLADFQRALRIARNKVQRVVVWRHLSGRAGLAETTMALTALADSLLDIALDWCHALEAAAEGEPYDAQGDVQRLVVFALGKQGGYELNLSSDIDLICAYAEGGKTGKSGKTNQQFFVQVVQRLIKVLSEPTGEGFAFRMDLRLRPYGDSGPLVQSFAAMERYFESSGRDWERYALIKARACAGDVAGGKDLLERLRPFVYRRYLDFAAIEAMREMRSLIRRDHSVHADNIKLGAGGIRDIEFLVQMLQLIWGGRIVVLQTNSLRTALKSLVAENLLTEEDQSTLWHAYEMFRATEHCLQAFRDEQTHTLPDDEDDQHRLASAMDVSSYPDLLKRLGGAREDVQRCLARWLDDSSESGGFDPGQALEGEWNEQVPGRSLQVISDIRLAAQRAPESLVLERLDRLLPGLTEDLVSEASDHPEIMLDAAWLRLEPLLRNVLRRSAYLVLLSENEGVRAELASLALRGDFFTIQLGKHPALLEELFQRSRPDLMPDVPSADRSEQNAMRAAEVSERAADLAGELALLLPAGTTLDLQQHHFDRLAEFKAQHLFRALLALARGELTVMRMADYMTLLAEQVIKQVLLWAARQVSAADDLPEGFIVVGYGKLGGWELGAGSDLDLVFINNWNKDRMSEAHQLTRRILNYLGMQTYFGQLYEVDIRLRPAGRDGTLVSSMAGFTRYQQDSAWLWEHQALVRARPVAGCERLAAEFLEVRRQVLGVVRDRNATRKQVVEMRERMRGAIPVDEQAARLKQGEGGIVDMEFMVQYLVLGWAAEFPSLLDFPDNARILEQAAIVGLLPAAVAAQLIDDYARLRHAAQSLLFAPDDLGQRELPGTVRVAELWQQLMVNGVLPHKVHF